ncbi:MAG: hypothetical protein A2Y03_04800 [Omnitrophica WOR_2 bacterium GWF2_38_59]|nr:MAG: hypothetical protein A2Y03_04800 [Omnitrophica WOR_2 bacterium GWF2_38_59]OGX53983.1 MAG: hypothetical protein A2267_03345 [Omnitrophica WOR_2 bacterium RIFOXYA12_FULL_38_10]OGX55483.1 MAG: hypothetical protein A2447_03275 [Omnitrophica WOR_2 bacterium RIFOXYC2_FULL_38_12]
MIKSNKHTITCSILILVGLISVFYPCFNFPPISDTWELLYSFHNLDSYPGTVKWLNILNFDPVEEVGYRPLANLIYFIIYSIPDSSYSAFNILNFCLYLLNILLFYRFSLYFIKNKKLAACFIALFAFLFNHCDIILWSCHIFILLGVCLFLIGYICFIEFLKTARVKLLYITTTFFILGTLCYESFALWPLAIIFIANIDNFKTIKGPSAKFKLLSAYITLGSVYSISFLLFLYIKSLGTYVDPTRSIMDFFRLKIILSSLFLTFFNILYNTVCVNIIPFIPFPLKVTENIYMAGPVINYVQKVPQIITFIGTSFAAGLFILFFILYRKKQLNELKIFGLFLFLILSETYIVFLGKLGISHTFSYCLSEFRYQYIPNAFFILLIAYVIDRYLNPSKKFLRFIYISLIMIALLNIINVYRVTRVYNNHLANLNKIISSIRAGMDHGVINKKDKVYIQKDIPDYLPSLCWNIEMGERFIKEGNYKWMFPKKDIELFADNINDATWIINKRSFKITRKTEISEQEKGLLIGEGKSEQFNFLAIHYAFEGDNYKAIETLKKAIEINSDDYNAYKKLEYLYRELNLKDELYKVTEKLRLLKSK